MAPGAGSVQSSVRGARDRFGRGGRFGQAAGNPFPVFGFLEPPAALPCTENPRVVGSIPTLATTPNPLIRMSLPPRQAGHRASMAGAIGLSGIRWVVRSAQRPRARLRQHAVCYTEITPDLFKGSWKVSS